VSRSTVVDAQFSLAKIQPLAYHHIAASLLV